LDADVPRAGVSDVRDVDCNSERRPGEHVERAVTLNSDLDLYIHGGHDLLVDAPHSVTTLIHTLAANTKPCQYTHAVTAAGWSKSTLIAHIFKNRLICIRK